MTFDYEQTLWGRGTASGAWWTPTAIRLRRALRALLRVPAGGSVLEIGCGAGQFIRAIKKYRPDLLCSGSDISQRAIDIAKTQQDGVSYFATDNTSPFKENQFDAVVIFDVLEHVESPAAILAEVRRILKPGGIFFAFVPCEGDSTSLWHWLERYKLKHDLTKRYAGHIQYFSRRSLFALLREANFRSISFSYSEHLLGQLLGVVAFMLMARSHRKNPIKQINNEEFFARGRFSIVRAFVNALVFIESAVLQKVPSPNVHVIAQKM